jgi:hypothetical protein
MQYSLLRGLPPKNPLIFSPTCPNLPRCNLGNGYGTQEAICVCTLCCLVPGYCCCTRATTLLSHPLLFLHLYLHVWQRSRFVKQHRARIFKHLKSPRTDSKEPIPLDHLACMAGRYDKPIPTQFLAPVDGLKTPAQDATLEYGPCVLQCRLPYVHSEVLQV